MHCLCILINYCIICYIRIVLLADDAADQQGRLPHSHTEIGMDQISRGTIIIINIITITIIIPGLIVIISIPGILYKYHFNDHCS